MVNMLISLGICQTAIMLLLLQLSGLSVLRCHTQLTLVNPLRTVDGYSRSLRDATGPVDLYSMQVTCIAA